MKNGRKHNFIIIVPRNLNFWRKDQKANSFINAKIFS